jgi:hypothetical protein
MIFTSNGTVYSRIEFRSEEEVENVVLDNFRLLFGDYSILLPKGLITTPGGKGTIPDGIIINFEEDVWYILEVERGIHGTWEHIAPQVVKQITAMQSGETKNKITESCIREIGRKPGFTDLLGEIDIQEIGIHGRINRILKKDPVVALPIDTIPKDLEEWARSLRVPVRIWLVEKYSDIDGNILYNIPDLEAAAGGGDVLLVSSSDTGGYSKTLEAAVKAGFLTEGQRVYMDYGQKGKPKTRFEGIVRIDGIEVDGTVSSPSISSLRCIQQVNSDRTTSNGWVSWKTEDGKLIDDAWQRYVKTTEKEVQI